MVPRSFEYYAPRAMDEALSLLQKLSPEAKILSGGQSLIPMMKLRLASPQYLVDINHIPDLDYLSEAAGFLKIGALARGSDLESSALVRSRYRLLADTTVVIADPLARNQATVCGNIAHGDPANDHPATMLALEATIVAVSASGGRELPIVNFFTGLFSTDLRPDEILKEIRVPARPPSSGGAYLKLERKVGDYATAGVAVEITLDAAGACTSNSSSILNAISNLHSGFTKRC